MLSWAKRAMRLVKSDFAASSSAGVNPLLGLEVATTSTAASATPVTTTATSETTTSTYKQPGQVKKVSQTYNQLITLLRS